MQRTHLLACALLLIGPPASASEIGHWYVTPQVGVVSPDELRELEDDDRLVGLSVGKHASARWSGELTFNTTELDGPNLSAVDLETASFDTLRVFRREKVVAPYLTVGMGATRAHSAALPSDTGFMAQAGVGLLVRAWRNDAGTRSFGFRSEVKARWVDSDSFDYFRDYLATLSLQFSFGPRRAAVPVSAPPLSHPPTPVSADVPVVTDAAMPIGAPVSLDSDGDGVLDSSDLCPETLRGAVVDANGCLRMLRLTSVSFSVNAAQLTPQSWAELDAVAASLARNPEVRLEIQGHTDSTGNPAYNQTLSQRRAEAVRDYLVGRGVPLHRLAARGYGASRPVADNTTPEGRALNRRVEMVVLDNPDGIRIEGAAGPNESAMHRSFAY